MVSNIMLSVMALVTNTVGYAIAKIREERGQDLVEYAVLLGGIAIVAGFVLFSGTVDIEGAMDAMGNQIADCINFEDTCGA